MKKCPYCGHINDDNATRCDRCYAGFPAEEKRQEGKPRRNEKKNDKE